MGQKIFNFDEFRINESSSDKYPINNVQDVEKFVLDLAKKGKLYHFDDSAADMFDVKTKEPMFTPEEAGDIDVAMDKVFDVCEKEFGKDGFWEGFIKDSIMNYVAFGTGKDKVYLVKGMGGKDQVKVFDAKEFEDAIHNPDFYDSEAQSFDQDKFDKWFLDQKNA